jgi:predicted nucleotidyltransferase
MQKKLSTSVRVFYRPLSRDDVLRILRERMPALQEKLPVRRAVLFGSYARGRHTIASDIDLLIVYEGEPREDAYKMVRRTMKIRRLEPHVYAEEEYAQVKATVDRMIRDGIPLEVDNGKSAYVQ